MTAQIELVHALIEKGHALIEKVRALIEKGHALIELVRSFFCLGQRSNRVKHHDKYGSAAIFRQCSAEKSKRAALLL